MPERSLFRKGVESKDLDLMFSDLIRFDDSGFIHDFTVMVRPRSAIEALLAAVAPRLASARGDV